MVRQTPFAYSLPLVDKQLDFYCTLIQSPSTKYRSWSDLLVAGQLVCLLFCFCHILAKCSSCSYELNPTGKSNPMTGYLCRFQKNLFGVIVSIVYPLPCSKRKVAASLYIGNCTGSCCHLAPSTGKKELSHCGEDCR